jgi:hypothetical protein
MTSSAAVAVTRAVGCGQQWSTTSTGRLAPQHDEDAGQGDLRDVASVKLAYNGPAYVAVRSSMNARPPRYPA